MASIYQFVLKPSTASVDKSLWLASIAPDPGDPQALSLPVPDQHRSVWINSRALAGYVAVASLVILSVHVVVVTAPRLIARIRARFSSYTPIQSDTDDHPFIEHEPGGLANHVRAHGGRVIFGFQLARVLTTLAWLVLSLLTYTNGQCSAPEWLASGQLATSAYATVLTLATTVSPARLSRISSSHATATLLAAFASYAYRDVWPLLTFKYRPADAQEGYIIWLKVAFTFLAGVTIPLFEPYPYIPVDPQNPQSDLNPEQATSLVGFFLYHFLDPVILEARRVPHLPAKKFPALADYDRSTHLIKESFPYLDPFSGAKTNSSLFWGLVYAFRWSVLQQLAAILASTAAKMALPIGTYKLLHYLEHRDDATVRPWVWIIWLAAAPIVSASFQQMYLHLSTATLARIEAIITSLVFEHGLRIRLRGETSPPPPPAPPGAQPTSTSTAQPTTGGSTSTSSSTADHSRMTTATSNSTSTTAVAPVATENGKKNAAEPSPKPAPKQDEKANLVGRINSLVTKDLAGLGEGNDIFVLLVSAPLLLIFSMSFLYYILGWSALAGLIVMVVLIPVPAKTAGLMRGAMMKEMKATDGRVQFITETLGMIRMIKLFGWEKRVQDLIAHQRDEELKWVWKRKILRQIQVVVSRTIPLLHMVVSYGTFTLIMKKELTAAIVFSSLTGFDLLKTSVMQINHYIPVIISANVALKRLQEFLNNVELLDRYTSSDTSPAAVVTTGTYSDIIGIGKSSFSWSVDSADAGFRLRINDDLMFRRGDINLIIGATGSGKTSLLMALLGEMHFIPDGSESWYNLPREGGVAYAAQESWVLNDTIKNNILFGAPYNEERYKKVVHQCALTRDLSLFEAGDETEVGEKGITLSGGQKARVTLARAVYSPAAIVLLDDVLAALDVHTSKWVVERCLQGDLLRGRTVILVTHNIALASPIASFVAALGADGQITSQGTVSDAVRNDAMLAEELRRDEEIIEKENQRGDSKEQADGDKTAPDTDTAKTGKLIIAEEIAKGRIGWPALKMFLKAAGGKWPLVFCLLFVLVSAVIESLSAGETWWMGWWARQYSFQHWSEVNAPFYLAIYAVFTFGIVMAGMASATLVALGTMRSSRKIHQSLVASVLGSTFRWLDTTPSSRIIARCTQDMQAVDGTIPEYAWYLWGTCTSLAAQTISIMIFAPVAVIPAAIMGAAGLLIGRVYVQANMSVKREMANAKAPVLASFGAAMAGLVSIRAYGAQEMFRQQSRAHIDHYTRANRTFTSLGRWLAIRMDTISGLFSATVVTWLVYGPNKLNPSNVGFVLNQTIGFTSYVLWWVRLVNMFELEANSLERIYSYFNIDHEPESTQEGVPPAYWPASGDLSVEKLSARYSPDGPKVLQDVSFQVKAGERIGIVGRTGSGKSSLTLALLRGIYTEGSVFYGGLATNALNLDALRSNVTIIPQVPELISGTLRHNLDLFGQYDDATLNSALRAAGLDSLQRDSDENRLSLDSTISGGGANLSVGQRQIVALARAMVRDSKLVILDEATSAIDYETDAVIQESLRKELKSDVTVITVAHRLQSIMDYDKIMVLDAGRLVEFASPNELLNNRKSLLRALVDESTDKDALYSQAQNKL